MESNFKIISSGELFPGLPMISVFRTLGKSIYTKILTLHVKIM